MSIRQTTTENGGGAACGPDPAARAGPSADTSANSSAASSPDSSADSSANSGPLQLEAFLPYRLNVLAEAVSQSLARLYSARYGIGIPEWRVLAALGEYRRMTAKEVGENSRMHKTKVSRAVAALAAKGLIDRKPDADDKRAAFLTLSAKGRAVYDELAPEALRFAEALEAALGALDRAALDRILDRLQARARELAEQIDAASGGE